RPTYSRYIIKDPASQLPLGQESQHAILRTLPRPWNGNKLVILGPPSVATPRLDRLFGLRDTPATNRIAAENDKRGDHERPHHTGAHRSRGRAAARPARRTQRDQL